MAGLFYVLYISNIVWWEINANKKCKTLEHLNIGIIRSDWTETENIYSSQVKDRNITYLLHRNVPVAPWNESEVPQASDMITLFTDTLNCLQTHLNGKMENKAIKSVEM